MSMPGGFEMVIIVLIILLLFGAKRIPELARGLGQGIQEFRKASDDIKKEIDKGKEDIQESTKYTEKEPAEKN
ncbi:MAG: twin-arginine translocase TatA/TatE family subunit [Balneolaceae bacterium]|jgi:sec-independent protein translocase protein TatA|nr:twin-arginine translocase TatA/TatE family subunit [Balneolaceae bacterium]